MDGIALNAAKRHFSPEFMNRLDKVIVFHSLSRPHREAILEIELAHVQSRIQAMQPEQVFAFECSADARDFLIREGTDPKSGARPLKRAIERHLVLPLARLLSTGQVAAGDRVVVDFSRNPGALTFSRDETIPAPAEVVVESPDRLWECFAATAFAGTN